MSESRGVTGAVAPTAEESAGQEFGFSVFAPLCLTLFLGGLWGQAFTPFVSTIADDLGSTVALVGQISTVSLLMMGLGSLFSGPLSERYGYRRSIKTGLAIGMLAALMFAGAQNYPMLLVASLIGGVGIAMIYGVGFGLVAASFTGERRRRALGITQATTTSAGVLGAPLLTLVASFVLWRGAFVFVAGLLLIALLLVARRLPPPAARLHDIVHPSIRSAYAPIFSDPKMRWLYSATTLRAIGFAGPTIYIGAFYIDEYGLSIRAVGLALMAGGIGVFLGNLVAGLPWLGRWDLRHVYIVTTAILGFGWLAVFTIRVPVVAAVVIAGATFFIAGISFTCHTSILANTTRGGAATTMTFNTAIIGFGIAAGVVIGGIALSVGGYPAIGITMPLFTIAAALTVWWFPRA